MSVSTRVYILGPASCPVTWTRLFEARPPGIILSAAEARASRLASQLAQGLELVLQVEPRLGRPESGFGAVLDALVAPFPPRSTLLAIAVPAWMEAALQWVWQAAPGVVEALALNDASNLAIDWPSLPAGSPSLVGLDLDWLPPGPAASNSRYPGGPGAAASGKA